MDMHPDNIFWLDSETTTLMNNPAAVPLEIAAVITDANLNELASFGPVVLSASEEELAVMNGYVTNMHTKTGLLDRVRASSVTREEMDRDLAAFAAPFFPAKGWIDKKTLEPSQEGAPGAAWYRGMVLAGNSVKLDFEVLERFAPETFANMDYRVIDVSSVGELARRWNRPAWESMPPKASDHTAMTDIRASIDELRYYRARGFGGRTHGPFEAA